jgi:hypothetical protein
MRSQEKLIVHSGMFKQRLSLSLEMTNNASKSHHKQSMYMHDKALDIRYHVCFYVENLPHLPV